MIATYLIQEIVDLTVCLNGDEPTQAELESLNEFSIEVNFHRIINASRCMN